MNGWLGRMPLLAGYLVFLTAVASAAPPPGEQIQAWVRQLDADGYAAREVASAQLAAAGEAAVDSLAAAATSASPEVAWRAIQALEAIGAATSDAEFQRPAAALESLSHGREIVRLLRQKRAEVRHSQAAAKIRSLGGKLSLDDGNTPLLAGGFHSGPLPPLVGAIADAYVSEQLREPQKEPPTAPVEAPGGDFPGTRPPTETLTLDEQWEGGDSGLAVLADLPQIGMLSIEGANLTDAALAHVATLPRLLHLHIRGGQFTSAGLDKFRQSRPATHVYTVAQERNTNPR